MLPAVFSASLFLICRHARLIALVLALALPTLALAQENDEIVHATADGAAAIHGEGHEAHAGLTQHAPVLFNFGWFQITNSMVLTWIAALGIIIFAQVAMRKVRLVPEGAQNFCEWLVEGLYNLLEGIVGHALVRKTFWFFATVFIFILFTNWFGLIPGVGTIGWGTPDESGALHHISRPLLRGSNADLNMTLAMAMLFFACWIYWAIQANGPGGFILHIFGPKGETTGFLKVLMVVVFALVGVLEIVSILFRPVSLSFRLYGNIFAGENMLESMATLVQGPFWLKLISGVLIPIPFYFMELLVGVVQALVFMLLTAVFTLLICQHDDSHGKAEHH